MTANKRSNRHGTQQRAQTGAYDADVPSAGYYRVKLRKGAVDSALAIWCGPTTDPLDGLELDRPWAWQAKLNGTPCDLYSFWPACGREPISREEHDRLVERNRTMDVQSPFFDPKKPLDINSAPTPF